jgi:hypothetical protein
VEAHQHQNLVVGRRIQAGAEGRRHHSLSFVREQVSAREEREVDLDVVEDGRGSAPFYRG